MAANYIREFQNAVCESQLPASARHVLLTMAVWANYGDGLIPVEHTRSLTGIGRATGMDRRTVERYLGRLDAAGWIIRHRPAIAESRKGARTWYELTIGKPELGA